MKAYLIRDIKNVRLTKIIYSETVGKAKYEYKKLISKDSIYIDLRAKRFKQLDKFYLRKIPMIELMKIGYVFKCSNCGKIKRYEDIIELDARIINGNHIRCHNCERRLFSGERHHTSKRLMERYNLKQSKVENCIRYLSYSYDIGEAIKVDCIEDNLYEANYDNIPIKFMVSKNSKVIATAYPYFLTEDFKKEGFPNKIIAKQRKREKKKIESDKRKEFKKYLNLNRHLIPDNIISKNKKNDKDKNVSNILEKIYKTEFERLFNIWKQQQK